MRRSASIVVIAMGLLFGCQAAARCPCGPDFCSGDPRYGSRLVSKKNDLARRGYPREMIALLDKADSCFAAIDRSPDSFSLMTVSRNHDLLVIEWTDDGERIAQQNLRTDILTAYYKFNVRRAFSCCQQPQAEERADWDARLSLSKNQAIACAKDRGVISCR